MPAPTQFTLNPAAYGLPTRDDLVKLRIWDLHYHGFYLGGMKQHEENLFYVERMGIERMLSLDIAGTPTDPLGTMLPAWSLMILSLGLIEGDGGAIIFGLFHGLVGLAWLALLLILGGEAIAAIFG